MRVYNKMFKLRAVTNFNSGILSIGKTAQKVRIPKQTLARWIRLYLNLGEAGLENKSAGIKETPNSPEAEAQVLQLWKENRKSRYRMRKDLKLKGTNISEYKIQKIYTKYNLIY